MTRSRTIRSATLLGLAVGVAGTVLGFVPAVLELEERAGLGWLFARRGAIEPPGGVRIVGMAADSAAALGVSAEADEWPRSLHARLVERLVEAGAAAIVFDLYFETPRVPADDDALAAAIAKAGNVILLERVRSDEIEAPVTKGLLGIRESRGPLVPSFKEGALGSAPFTLPVVPLLTSQFWTFGRAAIDLPTLPVVALQAYLLDEYETLIRLLEKVRPEAAAGLPKSREAALRAKRLEEVVQRLRGELRADPELAAELEALAARADRPAASAARLGALLDVYAGADHRFLNFYGPARTIPTTPYHEALHGDPDGFAGAVVFVGYSERRQPEQQDDFPSVFSERSGQNLSGVEIGATAFANMLERRRVAPLAIGAQALTLLAFGLACGTLFSVLPAFAAVAAALLVVGGYATAAAGLFAANGTWVPLIVPLLVQAPLALIGALLWNYHRVRVQRERIQAAFGYYLPPREVERLVSRQGDLAAADGELLEGTCLFTDAEQYTTVSERMDPKELRELLNRYYEVMLEVVQRHDGFVSDFAGDSMVALWASPHRDPANARRARAAALEIVDAIAEFHRSRGRVELPTGIGLDSGPVLLGNVGARSRFEYRAVGDIVSTAARLQGLNRVLRTRVVASGAVAAMLDGAATRYLGKFLLRGKTDAVAVHELVAGVDRDLLGRFADALAVFQGGDWAGAERRFATLASLYPSDGPSRYYARLSAEYAASPPADWDGVVTIVTK